MTTKHNILNVDDHRISQSGLCYLFASLECYAVVGTLDRGATVNAFVQAEPVDLVILDLNLPDVRREHFAHCA
jgi:two-component system nitrate/nitrite response regulator NarL